MLKSLLGIAPKQEPDGSFSPSRLALKLSTSNVSDFERIPYAAYQGERAKILVVFTEQKNMTMQNGKEFSTGNHPVEALLPMLHLRNAGFEFEIATPNGEPVVFEMWAMPRGDKEVVGIYEELKSSFERPRPLQDVVDGFLDEIGSYAPMTTVCSPSACVTGRARSWPLHWRVTSSSTVDTTWLSSPTQSTR